MYFHPQRGHTGRVLIADATGKLWGEGVESVSWYADKALRVDSATETAFYTELYLLARALEEVEQAGFKQIDGYWVSGAVKVRILSANEHFQESQKEETSEATRALHFLAGERTAGRVAPVARTKDTKNALASYLTSFPVSLIVAFLGFAGPSLVSGTLSRSDTLFEDLFYIGLVGGAIYTIFAIVPVLFTVWLVRLNKYVRTLNGFVVGSGVGVVLGLLAGALIYMFS